MNFAETVAGQRFLNHDFPSLVKSAERIAKANIGVQGVQTR